ncbi:hypothetical protein K450DRAFT_227043 [Umbelopsis ramanniana AG]|uniref:Uncharacterized protein n=1 Tax=Umbelopsis ramanniana AG TaxID=1314678 RepID=A0AAD5EFS6_UMBRA|nr:uncharacterized protein K450DRAFT_227043 [Umbelopsis ramanniana AG]KAI8582409.1 hypothetical protein K450DRAFT_227043 [Umbelopsis ramanniana AG]
MCIFLPRHILCSHFRHASFVYCLMILISHPIGGMNRWVNKQRRSRNPTIEKLQSISASSGCRWLTSNTMIYTSEAWP